MCCKSSSLVINLDLTLSLSLKTKFNPSNHTPPPPHIPPASGPSSSPPRPPTLTFLSSFQLYHLRLHFILPLFPFQHSFPLQYPQSFMTTVSWFLMSAMLFPLYEVSEHRHCTHLCSLFSSDLSQTEKHLEYYTTDPAIYQGVLTSHPLLSAQLTDVYFILISTPLPNKNMYLGLCHSLCGISPCGRPKPSAAGLISILDKDPDEIIRLTLLT